MPIPHFFPKSSLVLENYNGKEIHGARSVDSIIWRLTVWMRKTNPIRAEIPTKIVLISGLELVSKRLHLGAMEWNSTIGPK